MNRKENKNLEVKRDWLKYKFTQFPKVIDRIKEISGVDKTILRVLFDRISESGDGQCFPSIARISIDSGVNFRTAKRSLTTLRKLGFIDWEKDGRRLYFHIMPIPDEYLSKYSDSEVEKSFQDRKKIAEKAIEDAKERSDAARKNKIAKAKAKAQFEMSSRIHGKEEKPVKKKDNEVGEYLKFYADKFHKKFNLANFNEEKVVASFSKKEIGQIKNFIVSYGIKVLNNLTDDFFDRWDFYKKKWKIDSEYPTIGIIVTYGKSRIISMSKDIDSVPPKTEGLDGDVKITKIGW